MLVKLCGTTFNYKTFIKTLKKLRLTKENLRLTINVETTICCAFQKELTPIC